MKETDALALQLVGPSGTKATARALTTLGGDAVLSVANALRTTPASEGYLLRQVLSRASGPGALEALVGLLHADHPDVVIAALQALGRLRNPLALAPLTESLQRLEYRIHAVNALGELQLPEAVAPLRAHAQGLVGENLGDPDVVIELIRSAREDDDTTNVVLAIKTAVALAKLDDRVLCPHVELIAASAPQDPTDDLDYEIALEATTALRYIASPSIFNVVTRAAEQSSRELFESATFALLLLGSPRAVRSLIDIADRNSGRAAHAYYIIHELTGEWPLGESPASYDPKALASWWNVREASFDASVCYRLGKPLLPAALLPRLASHVPPVEELQIITSEEFSLALEDDVVSVVRRSEKWWEQNSVRFVAGRLHKYGHVQAEIG